MRRILYFVISALLVSGVSVSCEPGSSCTSDGNCGVAVRTAPEPGMSLAAGPAASYQTKIDRPTLDCTIRRPVLLVPVQPVAVVPVRPVPVLPIPTRGYTYVERRIGLLGLGGRVVHFQQYGQ